MASLTKRPKIANWTTISKSKKTSPSKPKPKSWK